MSASKARPEKGATPSAGDGCALRDHRVLPTTSPVPSAKWSARCWCNHGARVDPTTIADVTLPTSRAVGATSGVAVIGATTLSSCRRTTSLLRCIESDGVVANFSARQHYSTKPHQ
jgi:hypothetical protein